MFQAAAGGECPVSAVLDGRVEEKLCARRTHAVRQRLLHSTDSNELTVTFKTAHGRPTSRQMNFYLLHYEGLSASSLILSPNSLLFIILQFNLKYFCNEPLCIL